MAGLLIVELTSTQIRFLQLNKSKKIILTARKSLKFNKKITNKLSTTEVRRIEFIIKNTLKNSFGNRKIDYFLISDNFHPKHFNHFYEANLNMMSKWLYFRIKNILSTNNLIFVCYDDIVYIAYYQQNLFIFRIFGYKVDELSFFENLTLFNINKDVREIIILKNKGMELNNKVFNLLERYFKKAIIINKNLSLVEHLYSRS